MQICDSSSDEEGASNNKGLSMDIEEEVVVKKEKENKTPSPDISAHDKTNGSSSCKRRAKVKKMVTRTYEDEDGFISKCYKVQTFSNSLMNYSVNICWKLKKTK